MARSGGPGGRDTRLLLLNAAEQLFVAKGYAATSLSSIGTLSGVPKSLTYHYFGSKVQLWNEVKLRNHAGWAAMQERLNALGAPDLNLFRQRVEAFFHFLENHPKFVRLSAWWNLEGPELSQAIRPDTLKRTVALYREAQMRGTFRDDVRPENIVAMLISLSNHWFTARKWFEQAGLVNYASPQPNTAYRDDMTKVLLEGLKASHSRGADAVPWELSDFVAADASQPPPACRPSATGERRTARDPEATRTAILDAAQRVFAERGYTGTSMSHLAKEADVGKSLIHHHFGPKELLWNEARRHVFAGWVRAQQEINARGPLDGTRFAEGLVTYFRFLETNPNYVRIFAWTCLEASPPSMVARPDMVESALGRFREAQNRGALRNDIEAASILAMEMSLCLHWLTARNWFHNVGLADPENGNETYLKDMRRVFIDGLEAR